MNPIKIENLSHLFNELDKFRNPINNTPQFFFRGQQDVDWKLDSTLKRVCVDKELDEMKSRIMEIHLINKFADSTAGTLPLEITSSYWNNGRLDILQALTYMQHFGSATRLLDVTYSPWVALYFACGNLVNYKNDAALWVFDTSCLSDQFNLNKQKFVQEVNIQLNQIETENVNFDISFDQFIFSNQIINALKNKIDKVPEIEPSIELLRTFYRSDRIEAQCGQFLCSTHILCDFEEVLNQINGSYRKYVIPNYLISIIRKQLFEMNINAKTLFPGIEGIAKSNFETATMFEF